MPAETCILAGKLCILYIQDKMGQKKQKNRGLGTAGGNGMNYIVLDLEWNQCPEGKEKEEHLLPFEIIEIGAVKVNEKHEITDHFHEIIRPVVYRTLQPDDQGNHLP